MPEAAVARPSVLELRLREEGSWLTALENLEDNMMTKPKGWYDLKMPDSALDRLRRREGC